MSNTQWFWRSYAKAYDQIMGTYSRHKALVERHVGALDGFNRVLDSGCGPGHLVKGLLDVGHEVHAFDLNPEALKLLSERCGASSIVQGDANKLPYTDTSFDGVSSMLVLWAMEDPSKYLQEHNRVLRSSGRLVLSGPGPETRDSVPYQLEMFRTDLENQGLFPKLDQAWEDFLKYTAENVNHTAEHWFTHDEIADLVTDAGFEVQSIMPNPIYCGQGHVVVATKI